MKKILIVGCGDIGIRLLEYLPQEDFELYGLRRHIDALPEAIKGICADVTDPSTLQLLANYDFDVVVFTLTPGESSDERYQQVYVQGTSNVLAALKGIGLEHVIFVSSTGVYAQDKGQKVDEQSETTPVRFSGKRLLEAENLCLASEIPATIVRFAGIYHGKSVRVINDIIAGKPSTKSYTNRIHREDCSGFIAHLLQMPSEDLEPCYIGVDSEPVKMDEMKQWLAQQMDCEMPPVVDSIGPAGNKQCSNQRMLATGYVLKYSNYQEGYWPMLKELNYT